jgi:ribosomal protein S18 acetylase RimI-like enzyme
MQLNIVSTRRELRQFIRFPYRLYKDDPNWVAPLRSEQWAQFDPEKNPMLDHCDTQFFLLKEDGRVIGRCSAFVDHLAVEHWGERIGLFGSFECVDSAEAAHVLLAGASDWLAGQGMDKMRGPWSFASQEWGLEVEGGDQPPVILAPHNPPYYPEFFAAFGLEKAMDMAAYLADVDAGYVIPERYLTLTDQIAERYGVRVRSVDMRRLEADVMTIVDLSNRSIADNWGYYPVTADEARAMARDLKQIVNPEALLIAEDREGQPIGFALSLPDVNQVLRGLNGRLFPLGWLKLLLGLKKIDKYRMWGLGVIPEYHSRAIDTLLYRATHEALIDLLGSMEINYVLENNHPMNNALRKLGVGPIRRYRVYEMEI